MLYRRVYVLMTSEHVMDHVEPSPTHTYTQTHTRLNGCTNYYVTDNTFTANERIS